MAEDVATLMQKYKYAGGFSSAESAQLQHDLAAHKPQWDNYKATKDNAAKLMPIELTAPVAQVKAVFADNESTTKACMEALSCDDTMTVRWLLTVLYNLLREDSSCHTIFEEALKKQVAVYKSFMSLLSQQSVDCYIADKAAWILSDIIGNTSRFFKEEEVTELVSLLTTRPRSPCSDLGSLEAMANLMKSGSFRVLVWSQPGVEELVLKADLPDAHVYKSVFCLWMISFDKKLMQDIKNNKKVQGIVRKLREILARSRVEKVVRLCLTVLRNVLSDKAFSEEIVEQGILQAVQQLEFEKWRDTELYDDIRDMAMLISVEVNEMSNFDRYERELQTGKLAWGYIHSSKFWQENVNKFEENNFSALTKLAAFLQSDETDLTTLAVACHDIGEFVALHPLGKKQVARLNVKDRVMQLMSKEDPSYREVRREALLSCQKIMLNKWHDMDKAK